MNKVDGYATHDLGKFTMSDVHRRDSTYFSFLFARIEEESRIICFISQCLNIQ